MHEQLTFELFEEPKVPEMPMMRIVKKGEVMDSATVIKSKPLMELEVVSNHLETGYRIKCLIELGNPDYTLLNPLREAPNGCKVRSVPVYNKMEQRRINDEMKAYSYKLRHVYNGVIYDTHSECLAAAKKELGDKWKIRDVQSMNIIYKNGEVFEMNPRYKNVLDVDKRLSSIKEEMMREVVRRTPSVFKNLPYATENDNKLLEGNIYILNDPISEERASRFNIGIIRIEEGEYKGSLAVFGTSEENVKRYIVNKRQVLNYYENI
ncbi:hypothetical protein bcgnr5372_27330 [Bacillus luti]|nr:hypothetical protein [Bacillus cereus]HDR8331179.1 hypothetical protein [Bacillus cereus]HDR8338030.1 hypothetical protein [Bacillus cereus]